MTLIIGFGHKARHGKDEAIKTILASSPGNLIARKYGFGDALKREVNNLIEMLGGVENLFGTHPVFAGSVPNWVTYDPDADMTDALCPFGKQRTFLQWWGTEVRRAQDPDYWVKQALLRVAEEKPDIALICDVRFPNEVEGIRAAGGYVVRVDRVGFVSDVPQHISEKSLDHFTDMDWDYVIKAPDGRLDILQEEAINAFNFLSAVEQAAHA